MTFGTLLQSLQLPRDLSRTPLVATTFNLDKAEQPLEFDDLAVELAIPLRRFVNFELDLNLVDTADSLVTECSYNTDLYEPSTIRRWLAHLQVMLEAITTDAERKVGELPLLTEGEREQLLEEWNPRPEVREGGDGEKLHRRFEAQVKRTPGAVAVTCEGHELTYAELDGRANQLCRRLRELGVRADTLVGLCAERSLDLVVGILGILKAGGAYVPLDPSYPRDRLTFMVEDARVAVLVTQRELKARLPLVSGSVVWLDDVEGTDEVASIDDEGSVEDLAYVIYTSGSTGQPKGVLVTHRNVAVCLTRPRAWFGFDARDVWTLFHSYAL